MIGIDTNVLVRLITKDDARQASKAQKALQEKCSESEPGYINSVVLAEVAWVLARTYQYSRDEIAIAIEGLLQVREFEIQNTEEAWHALQFFRQSNIGFADLYLCVINKAQGCECTLTFDKKAAKFDGFMAV